MFYCHVSLLRRYFELIVATSNSSWCRDYKLQCVAVCCSVLQCVAVCCSVLQCVTVCCSVPFSFQITTPCVYLRVHTLCEGERARRARALAFARKRVVCVWHIRASPACNTIISTRDTTHCITLQPTVRHCYTLWYTTTCCDTLQHTVTHCNTLWHTVTHCNVFSRIATHCDTL